MKYTAKELEEMFDISAERIEELDEMLVRGELPGEPWARSYTDVPEVWRALAGRDLQGYRATYQRHGQACQRAWVQALRLSTLAHLSGPRGCRPCLVVLRGIE